MVKSWFLKKASPKEAKIKTIRIFKKLFVMSIVANNFLGLRNSSTTGLWSFVFSEILIISVLDKEKKATSVPDIIAEAKSNTNKMIIATTNILSIWAR